jgi:hypothetical protein
MIISPRCEEAGFHHQILVDPQHTTGRDRGMETHLGKKVAPPSGRGWGSASTHGVLPPEAASVSSPCG